MNVTTTPLSHPSSELRTNSAPFLLSNPRPFLFFFFGGNGVARALGLGYGILLFGEREFVYLLLRLCIWQRRILFSVVLRAGGWMDGWMFFSIHDPGFAMHVIDLLQHWLGQKA